MLIVVLFVGVGSAVFANEDIRNTVVGERVVKYVGIDNSKLLSIDIDSYNFGMEILDIQSDETNYYVSYQYKTLEIKNGVWQEVNKNDSINIPKSGYYNDLGVYLAGELSEVVQGQIKFLKESQNQEIASGLTQRTEVTEYTGLIGAVLDIKNSVFPGYEPIVRVSPVEEGNEINDLLASIEETKNKADEIIGDVKSENLTSYDTQTENQQQNVDNNQQLVESEQTSNNQNSSNNNQLPNFSVIVGSGKITEQFQEGIVYEPKLTEYSRIFITFRTDLGARSWHIGEIHVISGETPENNYFVIKLSSVADQDLLFDYWVIESASINNEPEQESVDSTPDQNSQDSTNSTIQATSTETTENISTTTPEENIDNQNFINNESDATSTSTTTSTTTENSTISTSSSTTTENVDQSNLIDQAIEVLEKGEQEQQIIENLKQELQ